MAYLKSLIVFIVLFIYSFCYKELLLYFINNEFFSTLNNEYFNLADTIFYVPILLVFFIVHKKIAFDKKINYKYLVLICLLAFLFKIIENPITNIHFIAENKKGILPKNVFQKYDVFSFFLSFVNIVMLTSLVEELLFRRTILSFFDKKTTLLGCLFSSILFSAYHFSFENIYSVKPVISLFLGFILSLIYTKYGLFYSTIFHSFYNFLWLLLDVNKLSYLKVLNNLEFGYAYWFIVCFSFIMFFYILKRINIYSNAN